MARIVPLAHLTVVRGYYSNWSEIALPGKVVGEMAMFRQQTRRDDVANAISSTTQLPVSDLISVVLRVPVEECLDFQFVDPATQAATELSLKPKVKAAKSPSQEF